MKFLIGSVLCIPLLFVAGCKDKADEKAADNLISLSPACQEAYEEFMKYSEINPEDIEYRKKRGISFEQSKKEMREIFADYGDDVCKESTENSKNSY